MLMWATEKGHLKVCKWLVQRGATLDIAAFDGDVALTLAVRNGHLEVVDWLLQRGASTRVTVSGESPLHIAAAAGKLDVLCRLVESGCSVAIRDS